ncbi:MAG: UDP-glucose 4-epimerase GalE [Firmicutes bacterium]|nr:UDP-glucose 4-epimerase GalE [Bacillota bacterium]MDH7494402.1 UDP-glucose 4-epimerase GalE [Bacillota bacterium]
MRVLVVGGAGYIGSHVVRELVRAGHDVVVYDNLEKGHREAVEGCPLVVGDTGDRDVLREVFASRDFDVVMHFAAHTSVAESMQDPAKYFHNNVAKGLTLLDVMREAGVRRMVFSSSAAVYGDPERVPIEEDADCRPTNVYGETKLMFERVLSAYDRAYGVRYVALRYFNAAGADPSGDIGEDHDPETQLIPLVLMTAMGLRPRLELFGTDYHTPDGTCVRDYVHVCDLATAHVLAAEALADGCESKVYNLGNGKGHTVRQVIETARRVTGLSIPVVEAPRRPGDPAVLVASSERIMRELGWKPRYEDLETIIATAWEWHRRHPRGYAG